MQPGWYADPYQPTALRWWDGAGWTPHTAARPAWAVPSTAPHALDAAVAGLLQEDPKPWGVRPAVLPLAAFTALIVAEFAIAPLRPDHGRGREVFLVVSNTAVEALLAAAVYVAGREIARRSGGWGRAFGWRRPTRADLGPALAGIGIVLGLRIALGILATIVFGVDAVKQSSNVHVHSPDVVTIVVLVLVVVVAAPLTEEFVFRGLVLRSLMRRWTFWPAAIASSVVFALGHTYEVSTVPGAVVLASQAGAVGLVNCLLVRHTGRLTPGIFVHATFNALAVVLLVAGVGT